MTTADTFSGTAGRLAEVHAHTLAEGRQAVYNLNHALAYAEDVVGSTTTHGADVRTAREWVAAYDEAVRGTVARMDRIAEADDVHPDARHRAWNELTDEYREMMIGTRHETRNAIAAVAQHLAARATPAVTTNEALRADVTALADAGRLEELEAYISKNPDARGCLWAPAVTARIEAKYGTAIVDNLRQRALAAQAANTLTDKGRAARALLDLQYAAGRGITELDMAYGLARSRLRLGFEGNKVR